QLEVQLRTIIETPAEDSDIKPFRLAKNYYKVCMNETQIELQGLDHMKSILKQLGGWPVLEGKLEICIRWFADKGLLLDSLESQLSHLHSSVEALALARRDLSVYSAHLAKSLALVSNTEEHASVSRVVSTLGELYERTEGVYAAEAGADLNILAELFRDYVCLIAAVKDTFHARGKIYQTWQSWQIILNKKREAKVKLELAGRSDKSIQAAHEVTEWEHKVERCQEDFAAISAMIKREYAGFEASRVQEFKDTMVKYLEELMGYQQQVSRIE
ncbi:sorting nexin-2-like, partial [Diaphorina citri]|uniref:Sorting nexin-2-like n=1 Tax=Diaphorina citri TaxID=121845 RepID=A0A3Q0JJ76_DIACI